MSEASTSEVEKHLRLLSIFHYVVAGLSGLFSLFPVIHLVVGVVMIGGGFNGEEAPPAFVGWIFVIFASLFILCGLVFAVLLALAGRFLARRRHYLYCLVLAGVSCMFFPFGTVLGIFTIITLMKEETKELFGVADEY